MGNFGVARLQLQLQLQLSFFFLVLVETKWGSSLMFLKLLLS